KPGQGGTSRNRDRLKRLQGRLFFLLNVEQLVQLGNFKDLVDLRIDIAQDQPAADRVHLLVEGDEFPQGRAGEVLDIAKVQEQFTAAQLVHKTEKLFTDDLNILFVQDLLIREIDDGHVTDVFNF